MIRSTLRRLKNRFFPREDVGVKSEIKMLLTMQNPVIVEAGAHIGSDSIQMSRIWPGATIHAFEPVPSIYKELVIQTKGMKNILTYPLALSEKTGTKEIFISSGKSDGSSSLLSPKEHRTEHPGVLFNQTLRINTVTLDEWATANQVDHIDFLWLDMQGYELFALKHGIQILKTVKAIYTEVFLTELYAGAPLYPEVRAWLGGQGFKVHKEELDWETVGNILFIRK